MQNLSLATTQNTALKNLTDAANKNNASADKSASAEPNTSFQMMLSKQVQAKQGNSEHVATGQKNKSAAGNTRPGTPAASDKQAGDKKAGDNKASTDADAAGNPGKVSNEQAELAPKKLLAAKEDAETKPDANAGTLGALIIDTVILAPVILAPVINAAPLVNTQGTSSPAVTDADSQLVSTAEIATQKQQSLDAVLSNALSQGKSANAQDKDTQGAGDIQDGKTMASEHARWLDAMLPGAARQAGSDESTSARLMLNAIKDSASKDVVMPASFQPAAQINTALSTQQAGSTNAINAYPGKSGWEQAISQKVVWMVGAGEQSATLTLNPPDLGPLQVVIHVQNDQADTTFVSDNAEVRQALQDGLSNLRDKMSEAGIQLGQANVSSGGQSQQEFQQATQNRLAAQLNNSASASQVEKVTNASTLVRVANGLVDTFA